MKAFIAVIVDVQYTNLHVFNIKNYTIRFQDFYFINYMTIIPLRRYVGISVTSVT